MVKILVRYEPGNKLLIELMMDWFADTYKSNRASFIKQKVINCSRDNVILVPSFIWNTQC